MPRLLAVGHVTRDRRPGVREAPTAWTPEGFPTAQTTETPTANVLGGSVSYAAAAVRRLGWEAAILTSAGPEFDCARELPGVAVFQRRSSVTTQFVNEYGTDGTRRQLVTARADDVDLDPLPQEWRQPDVLLLGPVAGELTAVSAAAFDAGCVGAIAQGYVREIGPDGAVGARSWRSAERDLVGVHVLFLSEHDLPEAEERARELLACVPMVALTRGWRGLTLLTREAVHDVPSLPRAEVDPTGAGDVFAATFLLRYHETGEPLEAAAYAACAASCVVEGVGAATLGDRVEIERRLLLRERYLEEGELRE